MTKTRRACVVKLMQQLAALQTELKALRDAERVADPQAALHDADDALTECLDRLDAATL